MISRGACYPCTTTFDKQLFHFVQTRATCRKTSGVPTSHLQVAARPCRQLPTHAHQIFSGRSLVGDQPSEEPLLLFTPAADAIATHGIPIEELQVDQEFAQRCFVEPLHCAACTQPGDQELSASLFIIVSQACVAQLQEQRTLHGSAIAAAAAAATVAGATAAGLPGKLQQR
eukprot:1137527-Pelagomonas_calceolata.AAC.1